MAYFYSVFPGDFTENSRDLKNKEFLNFLLLPELFASVSVFKGKQFLLARQTLHKCVYNTSSPEFNTCESVKQTDSASYSHAYCKINKKGNLPPNNDLVSCPRISVRLYITEYELTGLILNRHY